MIRRPASRGATYIESVAAVVLIGFAVLSSGNLLVRWHQVSSNLDARARAEHALATEMAVLRASLPLRAEEVGSSWLSGAHADSGLPAVVATRSVESVGRLQRITVSLSWGEDHVAVRELLVRSRR